LPDDLDGEGHPGSAPHRSQPLRRMEKAHCRRQTRILE
jgi:hypothetical protein